MLIFQNYISDDPINALLGCKRREGPCFGCNVWKCRIFTKIQKIASLATFQRKLPHCCTHAAFVWNRRGYIICQLRFDQRLKRWLISGVFFPAFRCITCLCTWIFLAAVRHCRDWSAPNDVFEAPAVLLASKGWVSCQGEGLWAVLHRCIPSSATAPWMVIWEEGPSSSPGTCRSP